MKLRVMLIGSGGREHALAWKLLQSPHCGKLFCVPGNAGMAEEAECIVLPVSDHQAVLKFCREEKIDLVVIGPEQPLVEGLADALEAAGIAVFGPNKAAAQLEGSKIFMKDLARDFNVPTAQYESFDSFIAASEGLKRFPQQVVVKTDGLAAGKGVILCNTHAEAQAALQSMMTEKTFGAAGEKVILEEFMTGEEVSFFAITDGQTVLPLSSAQDHKRAFDGDKGPNTGGMGAYSPAPVLTPDLEKTVMETILAPTLKGLRHKGIIYKGILYAGLMLTDEGPKLLEYNIRFGDPECQVLMPRLKSDLLLLLHAAAHGKLQGQTINWSPQSALTVVMAAQGYPGSYEKGSVIGGLDKITENNVKIFHAGTSRAENGDLIAAGGRVLNITAWADDLKTAQSNAYAAAAHINWPQGFYRTDIGWRAV